MTLKDGITAQYVAPHIGLSILLILLALNIDMQGVTDESANIVNGFPYALFGGMAAAVILLCVVAQNILPRAAKEVLVFWRLKQRLPGHRAFDKIDNKDGRIEWQRIQSAGGLSELSPNQQNTLWYRWYREFETHPSVTQCHKQYLAFRDLASITVLSIPVFWCAAFVASDVCSVGILVGSPIVIYAAYVAIARIKANDMMRQVMVLKSSV